MKLIATAPSIAPITNPASPTFGTGEPVVAFAKLIVTVWQTAITLGGLALLIMLIIGAIEWITAGGDKGKIESARNRMTQGVIGMLALMAITAISFFISGTLGINLLKPQFADNLNTCGCPTGFRCETIGGGAIVCVQN